MITNLANQVLMAKVDIPTCGAIFTLKDVITRIKRNALKWIDPLVDSPMLHLTKYLMVFS